VSDRYRPYDTYANHYPEYSEHYGSGQAIDFNSDVKPISGRVANKPPASCPNAGQACFCTGLCHKTQKPKPIYKKKDVVNVNEELANDPTRPHNREPVHLRVLTDRRMPRDTILAY
jgi:hypothetical protein